MKVTFSTHPFFKKNTINFKCVLCKQEHFKNIILLKLSLKLKLHCIVGVISTKSAVSFDFESQATYTLQVTASDGVLEDIKLLAIYIDNVNEKPYFVATPQLGDILETETKSRVVLDMDGSDPENDVLSYEIIGSSPSGAPFTIDSINGIFYVPFL